MRIFSPSHAMLGINARNFLYIRKFTTPGALRILDNKLRTKDALQKHGIPVPHTYAVVRSGRDLEDLAWQELPKSFALKHNGGWGGAGIVVLYGEGKQLSPKTPLAFWHGPTYGRVWVGPHKNPVSQEDLHKHILNILDGRFSLARSPDAAYFEERIKLLKDFKTYSSQGIPDIRVIVFNGVPVMAELRIPTQESGGRANLHLGAVGVGIDMGSGVTTYAVHH